MAQQNKEIWFIVALTLFIIVVSQSNLNFLGTLIEPGASVIGSSTSMEGRQNYVLQTLGYTIGEEVYFKSPETCTDGKHKFYSDSLVNASKKKIDLDAFTCRVNDQSRVRFCNKDFAHDLVNTNNWFFIDLSKTAQFGDCTQTLVGDSTLSSGSTDEQILIITKNAGNSNSNAEGIGLLESFFSVKGKHYKNDVRYKYLGADGAVSVSGKLVDKPYPMTPTNEVIVFTNSHTFGSSLTQDSIMTSLEVIPGENNTMFYSAGGSIVGQIDTSAWENVYVRYRFSASGTIQSSRKQIDLEILAPRFLQTCGDAIISEAEACDSDVLVCTTSSGFVGTKQCNAQCSAYDTCVADPSFVENVTTNITTPEPTPDPVPVPLPVPPPNTTLNDSDIITPPKDKGPIDKFKELNPLVQFLLLGSVGFIAFQLLSPKWKK